MGEKWFLATLDQRQSTESKGSVFRHFNFLAQFKPPVRPLAGHEAKKFRSKKNGPKMACLAQMFPKKQFAMIWHVLGFFSVPFFWGNEFALVGPISGQSQAAENINKKAGGGVSGWKRAAGLLNPRGMGSTSATTTPWEGGEVQTFAEQQNFKKCLSFPNLFG